MEYSYLQILLLIGFYEPLKKEKCSFFYKHFKGSRGHIFDFTMINMRAES